MLLRVLFFSYVACYYHFVTRAPPNNEKTFNLIVAAVNIMFFLLLKCFSYF